MSKPQDQVIETFAEVRLEHPDDFLKVKETLERIGVPSRDSLYQSCHILHKRGRFFIVHFKEMFLLDGKPSSMNDTDLGRRNTICDLLQQWGLVTVCDPKGILEPRAKIRSLKIIPHRDKHKWLLKSKYTIGKRR